VNTSPEPDDLLKKEKKEKKAKKKRLGLERMRIAVEKLQLARVKVTITFIALGFACYKIFYARIEAGKQPVLDFPNGRDIAIFLIFVGLVILLLATVQHRKRLANLEIQYESMPYSLSSLVSYIVLVLSFSLLLTVILRL
jgi:uncharacterized membrane protein YidH (DUF202 family)